MDEVGIVSYGVVSYGQGWKVSYGEAGLGMSITARTEAVCLLRRGHGLLRIEWDSLLRPGGAGSVSYGLGRLVSYGNGTAWFGKSLTLRDEAVRLLRSRRGGM